jgi:hypothetical protein
MSSREENPGPAETDRVEAIVGIQVVDRRDSRAIPGSGPNKSSPAALPINRMTYAVTSPGRLALSYDLCRQDESNTELRAMTPTDAAIVLTAISGQACALSPWFTPYGWR